MLLEDPIGSKSHGIDADEALGVHGVVLQALAAVLDVHGSQVGAVQSPGGLAASHDHVPLVEGQLDSLHIKIAFNVPSFIGNKKQKYLLFNIYT